MTKLFLHGQEISSRVRQGTLPGETPAAFEPDEFQSIPPDEMAFALSLFVGAASGTLPVESSARASPAQPGCRRLFAALSSAGGSPSSSAHSASEFESTLNDAFRAVWRQYRGDHRQVSICARVLGFYLIMERTRGAAVKRWITTCPETPETVLLHPAVIQAVGAVPLCPSGRLLQDRLLALVEELAVHDLPLRS